MAKMTPAEQQRILTIINRISSYFSRDPNSELHQILLPMVRESTAVENQSTKLISLMNIDSVSRDTLNPYAQTQLDHIAAATGTKRRPTEDSPSLKIRFIGEIFSKRSQGTLQDISEFTHVVTGLSNRWVGAEFVYHSNGALVGMHHHYNDNQFDIVEMRPGYLLDDGTKWSLSPWSVAIWNKRSHYLPYETYPIMPAFKIVFRESPASDFSILAFNEAINQIKAAGIHYIGLEFEFRPDPVLCTSVVHYSPYIATTVPEMGIDCVNTTARFFKFIELIRSEIGGGMPTACPSPVIGSKVGPVYISSKVDTLTFSVKPFAELHVRMGIASGWGDCSWYSESEWGFSNEIAPPARIDVSFVTDMGGIETETKVNHYISIRTAAPTMYITENYPAPYVACRMVKPVTKQLLSSVKFTQPVQGEVTVSVDSDIIQF